MPTIFLAVLLCFAGISQAAINFVAASTQRLTGSAPVTAAPFSVCMWARPTQVTADVGILTISDTGGNSNYFLMQENGLTAGDPVRWEQQSTADGTDNATSTTGFTVNTWAMVCAVVASTTSRKVYINGGSSATNTQTNTPGSIDTIAVGARNRSTVDRYFSGDIAEVAIWDVALSDTDVSDLYTNTYAATCIAPDDLIRYWPLASNSDLTDAVASQTLTAAGSPASATHPTIVQCEEGGGSFPWLLLGR